LDKNWPRRGLGKRVHDVRFPDWFCENWGAGWGTEPDGGALAQDTAYVGFGREQFRSTFSLATATFRDKLPVSVACGLGLNTSRG